MPAWIWDNAAVSDFELIDQPEELRTLCATLKDAKFLALDTEFVREKTYHPVPCLMQIAWREHVFCVDLLALHDLGELGRLLFDPSITKVLHSARQDLELIYVMTGQVPSPVYDTQIAAALLGFPEQCGYGALIEALLGVRLDKGHARTDWSRRPLSPEQLRYAADDVRFLIPAYEALLTDLAARDRAEWPQEAFDALAAPSLYAADPSSTWRKIKNWRQLEGPALARLQALAAWRETVALERNRPRRWILADAALLSLAGRPPAATADLETHDSLPAAVIRRHGDSLIRLLKEQADGVPVDVPDEIRLDRRQAQLASRLGKLIDRRAGEEDIAPALLATRAELRRLVAGRRDLQVLRGWRRQLVGDALLELIGDARPGA